MIRSALALDEGKAEAHVERGRTLQAMWVQRVCGRGNITQTKAKRSAGKNAQHLIALQASGGHGPLKQRAETCYEAL